MSILFDPDLRVKAHNLSKAYAGPKTARASLQESFRQSWNRICQKEITPFYERPEETWAIKNLSFEIKKGEVVGLLGSNGAGKSTLVRLLSRLTNPTRGSAWVEGKVASVLEVGSGFHPDLSAEENALLNGVFLGARKADVLDQMEDILSFSGLRDYRKSAVKKLSQGMQYRLAVSVALHSAADFLLLDEVLENTDREFEDRCWEKIQSDREKNKSLLFVSHNLAQVQRFCDRLLWLDKGQKKMEGSCDEVLSHYLV